jgi:glutathione S-transferase
MAEKTPVLYHIEISHYNEKARWALDYKHVPHVRKAPPPLMHTFWALAMTRKPTFPVLRISGRAIGDSTRIIEELERRYPDPPLYPAEPEERRHALELEEHFDEELGPYLRRWLFYEAIENLETAEFVNGALGGAPASVKATMRATAPVAKRLIKLRYRIDPGSADAAREKTEAAMDRLEQEIGESGYLVGDSFTVADLTAAALFFPFVRPPEAPHRFDAALPPRFAELQEEMSSRRGYQWVEEIYRKHRGTSAAIGDGAPPVPEMAGAGSSAG